MMTWPMKRMTALVASAILLGGMVDSAAADGHAIVFPTGEICADFGVGLDFGPDSRSIRHEFTDPTGSVVRAILAGRAGAVTVTRLKSDGTDTNRTFTVGAKGSMWSIV